MKYFICILFAALLASCAVQAPVDPVHAVRPNLYALGWDSTSSYAGYLQAETYRQESPGNEYGDVYSTTAIFYDLGGNAIPSGGVTLNSTTIPAQNGMYISQSTATYTGSQKWSVLGATGVPSMTDSLASCSQFRISFPHERLDTVSIGSGFTCTYGNPGTDSVDILAQCDTIVSQIFDSTLTFGGSQPLAHWKFANTGTTLLTSSMLSGFPGKGVLQIMVIAHRDSVVTASSRNYLFRSATAASVFTYVKP